MIRPSQGSGRLYLICTLVTAVTALMIYQTGGFGPGHGLAVLTLLALTAGFIVGRTNVLGGMTPYAEALFFSSTLLFHMIPAITDGLLRLPPGDPVLTDHQDPLLQKFYLAFLIVFIIGYLAQVRFLKTQANN